jgi:16S rRNA (guanine(966)-N(2))-methyltransferase RsmD
MKTTVRIVAGSLRGRKLAVQVNANLRPTPQMVREALFSLLGNAVPDRPFFDVFAGTGVVGLEALSRGARSATFVERDFRLSDGIEQNLRAFRVADAATVARADVYRWADRWQPPAEPVTVFLSPPFADYAHRPEDMLKLVAEVQRKVHPDSVVVLQAEKAEVLDQLPRREEWEERRYGRNILLIWVKELEGPASEGRQSPGDAEPASGGRQSPGAVKKPGG